MDIPFVNVSEFDFEEWMQDNGFESDEAFIALPQFAQEKNFTISELEEAWGW